MVSGSDTMRGPAGTGLHLWSNSTVMDCVTAMGTDRRGLAFRCLFLVFLVPAFSKCFNETAKEEAEPGEVNSTSAQRSSQIIKQWNLFIVFSAIKPC